METIREINEVVFNFLEEYRMAYSSPKPFLHTLRRNNNEKRLENGQWFHGNEKYMVVSFWSGMDWKNKTPNIIFRILTDGTTSLTLTSKDSLVKAKYFRLNLIEPLEVKPDGESRWTKLYQGNDYLKSLRSFIENDKRIIDNIVINTADEINFEDPKNRIGFIQESAFSIWLANVLKYRKEKHLLSLPYALTNFSIKNYRPIISLDVKNIPSSSQFIFLTGLNGSGKSQILKALSIIIGHQFYYEKYSGPSNSPWIIQATVRDNGKSRPLKIMLDELGDQKGNIPVAFYGPARLSLYNKDKALQYFNPDARDQSDYLHSIHFSDGILLDFNRWVEENLNQSKTISPKGSGQILVRYENIKQLLIDNIPGLADIREAPGEWGENVLLYFEEDQDSPDKGPVEQGVTFHNLSSGMKSMIGLMGDIMVRLFEQQPELHDPAELAGIVIIDEIDLHLHPIFQKQFPVMLRDCFPKIQFILSTHSPIPLLGAPEDSRIYVISKDGKSDVRSTSLNYINIKNMLPNNLLTSPIFGLNSLISVNNQEIEEVDVHDNLDDTAFMKKVDDKIEEYAKKLKSQNNRFLE